MLRGEKLAQSDCVPFHIVLSVVSNSAFRYVLHVRVIFRQLSLRYTVQQQLCALPLLCCFAFTAKKRFFEMKLIIGVNLH